MAGLVDLSLFDVSPANDGHFALDEDHPMAASSPSPYEVYSSYGARSPYGVPSSLSPRPIATMKPLPPIPHRRNAALKPDSRVSPSPSRCILERMKRLRLDTVATSAAASLPKPPKSTPTIQQRRRRVQTEAAATGAPSLTIPTGFPAGPDTSVSAYNTSRPNPPMIWLPEEQMWLVADSATGSGSFGGERELYGYYAPAPHSDPGPWQDSAADSLPLLPPPAYDQELPEYGRPHASPAYSQASSISPPNVRDSSPVRTQFMNLMEAQRNDNASSSDSVGARGPTTSSRTLEVGPRLGRDDRPTMSPLFQEALSGVGLEPLLGSGDYEVLPSREPSGRSQYSSQRPAERRDSIASDSIVVSPLSPEPEVLNIPWKMQRTSSNRV